MTAIAAVDYFCSCHDSKGRWRAHYFAMIGCFAGEVAAGLSTLHPDRLVGGFFFGTRKCPVVANYG